MNTIFDKVAIEKCCDDFFSLYDVTCQRTRDMCHAKRVHTHAVAEMTNFDAVPDADKIVLEKAIHHHSDFHLPNDLIDRQRIFCDIIREADCIDIFRSIVTSGWKTLYNCTAEDVLATDISPAVEEAFQRRETVKNSNRVTLADYRMAHIALCFVLKSQAARRRAVEQGYLQQLMDIEFFNPTIQAKFLRAKIIVKKFIEEA